jgi:hypothetical protein
MNCVAICANVLEPKSWAVSDVSDVREFLVNRFNGSWPKNAKIYHKSVAESNDVTPYDEATVEHLGTLKGKFFVVVWPNDPITIAIVVAVAVAAVALGVALFLRPSANIKNQQESSPNNQLGDRQNRERINERIPDIYGEVWSTPDLIQQPYKVFINNNEVEYSYMCIGRGHLDIAKVRDDLTPIEQISQSAVEIYGPNTSPNSGDEPQMRIGSPIREKIINVSRSNSVNGQTLIAPNKNVFIATAENSVYFTPDAIYLVSGGDFSSSFVEGQSITLPSLQVAPRSGTGDPVNIGGTYTVAQVSQNELILDNPGAVNGAWTDMASWSTPISKNYSLQLTGDTDSSWVGPYVVNIPDVSEVWCNFVGANGCYEIDSKGNQIAVNVRVEVRIQAINSLGVGIGDEVSYTAVVLGSSTERNQLGTTLKCKLPLAGPCKVRVRRTTNTDLRTNFSVSDEIKWRDMMAVSPITPTHFGNVTTIQAVTWPTQDAIAIKERKLNCLVARLLPTKRPASYTASAATLTMNHSGPLSNWTWWAKWGGFIVPTLPSDAVITGIRAAVKSSHTIGVSGAALMQVACNAAPTNIEGVTPSGVFYNTSGATSLAQHNSGSKGTSLSFIATAEIGVQLQQTLNLSLADIAEVTEVAIGIIYTSVSQGTPSIDPLLDPPTSLGPTESLAWAVPTTTDSGSGDPPPQTNGSAMSTVRSYVGYFDTGTLVSSKNAADIFCAMALDEHIGRRIESELDVPDIYAKIGPGGDNETYFGTPLCSEFCYTFDDSKVSFEESASDVANAAFSQAYRRGNVLSVYFEKAQANSTILFNHRNKYPNSEVRTVRFGHFNDNDGLTCDYIDPHSPNQPDIDFTATLYFPVDKSATNAKKVTLVGVRNNVQAIIQGWRIFNKMRYQNTAVEFNATQEAAVSILTERILVADNTRNDTQDGMVKDVDGLELTLSQPVTFVMGRTYTIFLQLVDGTIQSLGITAGSAPDKVVLDSAPALDLVYDPTAFAPTPYVITDDTEARTSAFLLTDKSPQDGMLYQMKGMNYDSRYYDHDSDFIDNVITENGEEGGYNAGYGTGDQTVSSVFVYGRVQPWSLSYPVAGINSAYHFGRRTTGDGNKPVVVPLTAAVGSTVTIEVTSGTVRCSDARPWVDGDGQLDYITGDSSGAEGTFPTYYAHGGSEFPLGLGGLMMVFAGPVIAGDQGQSVIAIHACGNFNTFVIPVGATNILLGINDDQFNDNEGGFNVNVTQTALPAEPDPSDIQTSDGQVFLVNGKGPGEDGPTTLAILTGDNTSFVDNYNKTNYPNNFTGISDVDQDGTQVSVDSSKYDDSMNPVTPSHKSGEDVGLYHPTYPSLKDYAHFVPFKGNQVFGQNCNTETYINNMLNDMINCGYKGVIVDWYGQGTFSDQCLLKIQTNLAARAGNTFKFIVQLDHGISGLTQAVLITQIGYITTQYLSDANYGKQSTKPILQFFDVDTALGNTAMAAAKAATTGSTAFWMPKGIGNVAQSWVDGTFDWTHDYHHGIVGGDRPNLTSLGAYITAAKAAGKPYMVCLCRGFNGTLTRSASWSDGKYLPTDFGTTLLSIAAYIDANIDSNCMGVQTATWNDHKEGTGVEQGVENEIAVTASISTHFVNWSASGGTGDETTIAHYDVYYSLDDNNLILADQVNVGVGTFDLSTLTLVVGTVYKIYVHAIGKPLIRCHMSNGVAYTA